MSHYAQIVEPLGGVIVDGKDRGADMPFTLPTGAEIKCVEVTGHGYRCHARVTLRPPYAREAVTEWVIFDTAADLPAFTDKGKAHRERAVTATLRKGRPPGGGSTQERAVAFRPTAEQREWLQDRAKKKRTTMSKLVREALMALGMPR